MRYYLLSVWKRNGERSYSQCCSTSEHFDDLLHNMTLYTIQEDEMYVISLCENGNERNQGGYVACNWYYNNIREQIAINNNKVNKTIIDAIYSILEQ